MNKHLFKSAVKPFLFLAGLGIMIYLARAFQLGSKLDDARIWIEGLGPLAPLAFIGVYIIATVLAVPGSALTVAAGAVFGSVFGVIYVSIGSTLGAAVCFLIARYFARTAIAGWLNKNEKFRRLDDLSNSYGSSIVAVTRLIPIFPFNLLNYGFGLTQVRFSTYVLWSWLCMLPGTILYVVGVDAVVTGISKGEIPWHLIGVAGLMMLILFFLIKSIRKKINFQQSGEMVSPGKDRSNESN